MRSIGRRFDFRFKRDPPKGVKVIKPPIITVIANRVGVSAMRRKIKATAASTCRAMLGRRSSFRFAFDPVGN